MTHGPDDITTLLRQATAGDDHAFERLLPLVYDELRRLAASQLRRERKDHTLQPTALVNEAYLKLIDQTQIQWESRGHFLAIAATAMRRILVDHARGKSRIKRAAPGERVAFLDDLVVRDESDTDLVALDEALTKLGAIDPRKVKVIEMRYFAGLTIEETAAALGIAPATVKRDWEFARLWLLREMTGGKPPYA
ncbi:MAG: sigma-70 family RNA polymerase sigma factor [Phycisphaerales bacterium]|nr:sigma-70 family RNA polymerase sigma factor [Phycisphaerales bacterium]